jgi:hypothetical protein
MADSAQRPIRFLYFAPNGPSVGRPTPREDAIEILESVGVDLTDTWFDESLPMQAGGGATGLLDASLINVGLAAAGLIAGGYVSAIARSAGEDTWKAVKRGVSTLRGSKNSHLAEARIQIAIRLDHDRWIWINLPRDVGVDALQALNRTRLPSLPDGPFFWSLQWSEAESRWLLELEVDYTQDSAD